MMAPKSLISREEAAQQGLKRFYTGVPCIHGHVSERYTTNQGCIACMTRFLPKNRYTLSSAALPRYALIFSEPDVTPEEMQAAFVYIERHHWHDAAVQQMRKAGTVGDYVPGITRDDEIKAHVEYERIKRLRQVRGDAERIRGTAAAATAPPVAYTPNPVPFKHEE